MKAHRYPLPSFIRLLTVATMIGGALALEEDKQQPAAHEDVFGASQWTMENAGRWGGDASRIAVVGESAGGNIDSMPMRSR